MEISIWENKIVIGLTHGNDGFANTGDVRHQQIEYVLCQYIQLIIELMELPAQCIDTTCTTLARKALLRRAITSVCIMEASWALATTLECIAVSVGYR